VVAALLGAEEYGFGTSALVALGCDMARQCHLDTCPTGIATQRADLRAKFTGTPDQVVAFFLAIAQDVRRELAALGLTRLGEAVGRIDLLHVAGGSALALDRVVGAPTWRAPAVRRDGPPKALGRIAEAPVASALEERLTASISSALDALAAIESSPSVLGRGAGGTPRVGSRRADPIVLAASVTTAERTLGARISGELERARDRAGRRDQADLATGVPLTADALRATHAVELRLSGSAGQSLGAFLAPGIRVVVTGVANDYVGKGLSGGTVVVRPPISAGYRAEREAIAGNTCLYGATGGRLHLVGRAGMRFAVRNSGAAAVVEGMGAHGCEYMTAGVVVVLGPTGRNFGAGMTGGRAWLWDPERAAPGRVNAASVTATALPALAGARDDAADLEAELAALVGAHAAEGSGLATSLLADWSRARAAFWLVEPVVAG
jgi:glutamate synthase domain-containing protein 3